MNLGDNKRCAREVVDLNEFNGRGRLEFKSQFQKKGGGGRLS